MHYLDHAFYLDVVKQIKANTIIVLGSGSGTTLQLLRDMTGCVVIGVDTQSEVKRMYVELPAFSQLGDVDMAKFQGPVLLLVEWPNPRSTIGECAVEFLKKYPDSKRNTDLRR